MNFCCVEKNWPRQDRLDREQFGKETQPRNEVLGIHWAQTAQFELKSSLERKHNRKNAVFSTLLLFYQHNNNTHYLCNDSKENENQASYIDIDDMLIFAKSQQELEMARDTVLFLLQNLGFVINWEKSVLIPTKTMEFLGVTINSEEMTFSIPDQKMQKIICLCEQATQSSHLSVRNLASIVGKLMSTA